MSNGGLVAGAVNIVGSEHIGDEDSVERAALEELRQFGPVGEVLVSPGLVIRMAPHSRRLVGNAVHVEGVEANLARGGLDRHPAILDAHVHNDPTLRNTG
jgi:hypothetical protein